MNSSGIATHIDQERLARACVTARRDLLDRRHPTGHWVGRLSASALSTATAVSALSLVAHAREEDPSPLVGPAMDWLLERQNADGGWGDTVLSHSNIATTMLVASAIELVRRDLAGSDSGLVAARNRADQYIQLQGGIAGLRRRYGRDKTFAVPILTNCALAGRTDWKHVAALPFELACFPQRFYRWLRMPVVSYAIPALVSVGQAIYHHRRPWNPITRSMRTAAVEPSLRVLENMQPASGGYLEAIPLTSFVVMSLASIGRVTHPVVRRGVEFLRATALEDGSWPIDTNLAAWVTTLSINALGVDDSWQAIECLEWLVDCQHTQRHPFTGADPGGWGWSDLSGAVPDADDTPGALLALRQYYDNANLTDSGRQGISIAAAQGVRWLLGLQNSDGGWPTFCRGWGKLPFDRSGPDLTAHALRALGVWPSEVLTDRIHKARRRGFTYLERSQNTDGSWTPLWFGNQDHPREENPVYGTARVLLAGTRENKSDPSTWATSAAVRRGIDWLIATQHPSGGWSGAARGETDQGALCTVEETAVTLEALIRLAPLVPAKNQLQTAINRGLSWLVDAIETGRHLSASPIGLYFAKLWYYEELYPVIFAAGALTQATRLYATNE